ncbi:hypothetical protein RB653_006070 [Dictyostelium firmibasis]|uniref:Guanylyl cyclase n=1 Tax=Dictyostelium firmibasis TaxID=79012 RepID=A0AAN7U274_9MYCE
MDDDESMILFKDVDIDFNNSNITLIRNIESIHQRFEWDCGLCCIVSILRWLKRIDNSCNKNENIENIYQILNTKSIWSIDLSNVFSELGVNHKYYTNTIGVKIDHREMQFYKDSWESDSLRVNNLFLKTMDLNPSNLHLVSSSNQLPIKYYIDHISKGLPIILLVDSCHLYCNICKISYKNNFNSNNRNWKEMSVDNQNENNSKIEDSIENEDKDDFCGHYIILVGYNYETKEIIYIDPSSNQRFCTITEKNIDNARMKSGTDLDSIFILNQP